MVIVVLNCGKIQAEIRMIIRAMELIFPLELRHYDLSWAVFDLFTSLTLFKVDMLGEVLGIR